NRSRREVISMSLDRLKATVRQRLVTSRHSYQAHEDSVYLVAMHDSARMRIITRADNQTIREPVTLARPAVATRGSFAEPCPDAERSDPQRRPVPMVKWDYTGYVVINGGYYSIPGGSHGHSNRIGRYLAYGAAGGNDRYRFGIGNVPTRTQDGLAVTFGLSGLIPLIDNG